VARQLGREKDSLPILLAQLAAWKAINSIIVIECSRVGGVSGQYCNEAGRG